MRGGRVLPGAVRAALPLYAGQAVLLGSGFLLNAFLVAGPFRDDPERMARLTLLTQALQWVTVAMLLGLPAALLRLLPARPGDAADLALTARVAVGCVALAVAGTVVALPGLAASFLGDREAAESFRLFAWRGVFLAMTALCVATLHAAGRLGRKAVAESGDRVSILVLAAAGALAAGFDGVVLGYVAGAAAGAAVAWGLARGAFPGPGRFRFQLLRDLLRVARPQLVLTVLETLRPFVVLRLATITIGDAATGLLGTAVVFTLPLVALPEMAAQALFPRMLGPDGERAHVADEHRTLLREVFVAGIPILALYGGAAAWLLPQAGTGRYAGAVAPLLALLPGVLAHGITAHTGYVLLVRDRLGRAAAASAATLVATGVLAHLLLGPFGAVGGAAALSSALVLRAALFVAAARRA